MHCSIVAFPTALVVSLIALVTNASEVIQAVLVFVSLAVVLTLTVVKVVRDDTRDHAIKHRPVAPREPSYGGWSPPFGTAAYYLKEINDRQNRGDL